MLTRPVLAALAVGIAGNDEDLARAALGRLDPVVRGFARRKLARAVLDALLIAPGPPAHVLRIAALTVAGEPVPSDPVEVEAAYDRLPRWTMPRQPVWTLTTAAISALVIGGVVFGIAATRSRSHAYHRPVPVASAQAFQRGGAPLHDPAIDALFAGPLTGAIVALDAAIKAHDAEPGAVLAAIRAPQAITAHGAALATAWAQMIDQLALAGAACRRGDPTPHEADQLREAARDVSARLADAGLGYVIDGRLDERFAMLQAYRVDDVVFVRIGDQPRRVLSVERADQINLRWAVLGLHTEGIADPIVASERIESFVTTDVFPVLAAGAQFPLGDDAWLRGEGAALAATCGDVVRNELAAALGRDASAAGQIAAKLAERGTLIDQWSDRATRNHLVLLRTTDLFLPPRWLDQLDGFVPDYQLRKAAAIEDDLAELEAPRIASRLQDLVAASVRRHEAQHGHDADRDAELRYPATLEAMLGPALEDGRPVPIVRAARAELSAYLSQIANDPVTPQLTTWGLARHAFTPDRAGTGEMFAAYVVLEGLARQLAPARAPAGRGRARLAPLAQIIVATTGDQLRDAARTLWVELYGEPIATITP